MIVRTIRLDSRRALAGVVAAASLFLQGGCALNQAMYADEQIRPYVRSLPKRPDYPLARTFTWKFYHVEGKARPTLSYFIADGKLIRSKQGMAAVQMYAAQPSTSGVTSSEAYTQKAREATRRGDHQSAQVYHGASAVSLQTQIASERAAVGAALSGAIMASAAALADAGMIWISESLAAYVKDDRAPLIGDGAPEGTVLELFFRRELLRDAEAKPTDLLQTWETVATLKDANGKIWRSSASFKTYFFFTLGSGPLTVPEEYQQSRYVLLQENSVLPATNKESYAAEQEEIGKIQRRRTSVELGVTAARAIEDLYEQIEFAKRKR